MVRAAETEGGAERQAGWWRETAGDNLWGGQRGGGTGRLGRSSNVATMVVRRARHGIGASGGGGGGLDCQSLFITHVNIILLLKLLLKLEAATKKNYFLHKKFSFIPKITLY